MAQEDNYNISFGQGLPVEMQNGSATAGQILEYFRTTDHSDQVVVTPDTPNPAHVDRDLDLDGRLDLLVEGSGGGSAGREWFAFLATASGGYRYIGRFLGRISPVAGKRVDPPLVVIGTSNGAQTVVTQLVAIRPEGLQMIARKEIMLVDCGPDELLRMISALLDRPTTPMSVVREAFGRWKPE
jgi:hypothetical protein